MNVSVIDLSENQKKLQVEIPAPKVQQELESRYHDLAKQVRLKGFRPGKIPRSILKSYYGKSVESEVSNQLVQDTFPEALRESALKPLVEASVEEMQFEESGSFTYVAVVDVAPPFSVEDYKGLQILRKTVAVGEEQVQAELERLREQQAQLRTLETERPIREGDVAIIDFTPSIDGVLFEKGKSKDYMVEVGQNALHPAFDQHLIGYGAGDDISFDLDYPEEERYSEFAGKTVHFEVTVRELKEKTVPDLDDDFAQEVNQQFETLDALKQEIETQLRKREEGMTARGVQSQMMEQLIGKTPFELSAKVIEREVERMISMLQQQFVNQGLKIDTVNLDTPAIRAEYRPEAEKNLRWRLICRRIAEQEQIELSEEEMEEIYADVARMARMSPEALKEDESARAFLEQTQEMKIQEKVVKYLENEAEYSETPTEANSTEQE